MNYLWIHFHKGQKRIKLCYQAGNLALTSQIANYKPEQDILFAWIYFFPCSSFSWKQEGVIDNWEEASHSGQCPLWICVCAHRDRLFVTPWTATCKAPLSMGCSRPEYWIGLPSPPAGDLPDPGIQPASLMSPALQVDSLSLSHWQCPRWPSPLF